MPNSQRRKRQSWRPYLFAIGCTAITLAIKLVLEEHASGQVRIFLVAVAISAWFGGVKPGLLAAGLAALFELYHVIPPSNSFALASSEDVVRFFTFVAAALIVGLLTGSLHDTRQRALEYADKKAAFLATVTHELRTPLHAIIGMTELMNRTPQTPEQREYTRTITQASDALLSLINRVLDFSKIESGMSKLEQTDFDLKSEVDSALALVRPRMLSKSQKFELRYELHGEERRYRGVPAALRHVILNLLDNASKFTPEGGLILLRIEGLVNEQDQTALRVEVTDQGIGIPHDLQDQVFESFFQVQSSSARSYEGTGLGLSICKGLVEQLGGEIGVISSEGKGSTFWFTFLLEHSQIAKQVVHVLIVEDNPVNQVVTERLLQAIGCEVAIVSSGAEALSKLSDHSFDAILLDCHMPGMDGFETTRRIRLREASGSKRTPIIAVTADTSARCLKRCLDSGFDDFLPKPVKLEELSQALLDNVEQRRDPELDQSHLRELRRIGGLSNSDLVGELTQVFLAHTPGRLRELRAACLAGDKRAIAREAHSLKSACASLGALRMSRICQKLESGTWSERRVEALEEEFERVKNALHRETSERA